MKRWKTDGCDIFSWETVHYKVLKRFVQVPLCANGREASAGFLLWLLEVILVFLNFRKSFECQEAWRSISVRSYNIKKLLLDKKELRKSLHVFKTYLKNYHKIKVQGWVWCMNAELLFPTAHDGKLQAVPWLAIFESTHGIKIFSVGVLVGNSAADLIQSRTKL